MPKNHYSQHKIDSIIKKMQDSKFTTAKKSSTYKNYSNMEPSSKLFSYHQKQSRSRNTRKSYFESQITKQTVKKTKKMNKSSVTIPFKQKNAKPKEISFQGPIKKKPKKQNKTKNISRKQEIVTVKEKIKSNKEVLKENLSFLNGRNSSYFLSKISSIYDLVLENEELPVQIQVFLRQPLRKIRQQGKSTGKYQITEQLYIFKNQCLDLYKEKPKEEIMDFMSINLPKHNRWTLNNTMKSSQKTESLKRSNYFSNLSRRSNLSTSNKPENDSLERMEKKINSYLDNSFKGNYRCYI